MRFGYIFYRNLSRIILEYSLHGEGYGCIYISKGTVLPNNTFFEENVIFLEGDPNCSRVSSDSKRRHCEINKGLATL